jgi:UPF0716 protein FxsA
MITVFEVTIETMAYIWWILFLPLLDLLLLSKLPTLLGGTTVFIYVVSAAAAGILAIRTGGFRFGAARARAAGDLLDRAVVLLSGLLLIFPGPASDVVGIALLIPRIRARVIQRLLGTLLGKWFQARGRGPRPETPPGSPLPEDPPAVHTGRSKGEYPGAEAAREVEFQNSDAQREELKTNKR